jgi:DNA-binding NarL/FixJ family response regulator
LDAITMYLIDRHQHYRSFLISCFNEYYPEVRVLGESPSLNEALRKMKGLRPDVVIADIYNLDLEEKSPVEAIKQSCPDTRVVILTISENEEQFFNAIAAGAAGYLLKESPLAEIVDCVKQAVKGRMTLPRSMALKLFDIFHLLESIRKNSPVGLVKK